MKGHKSESFIILIWAESTQFVNIIPWLIGYTVGIQSTVAYMIYKFSDILIKGKKGDQNIKGKKVQSLQQPIYNNIQRYK